MERKEEGETDRETETDRDVDKKKETYAKEVRMRKKDKRISLRYMRLLSRTHRLKMAHGRSCSVTAGIIPPVDAKTWVVGARLRSGTSVTIAEPGCHSASSVPSRMTWAHPPPFPSNGTPMVCILRRPVACVYFAC